MEAGGRGGWASSLAPSCPTWEGGVGTGHKLTDSRTQSRAHGSRINNFMYTLHTICTALPPALALGGGVGGAGEAPRSFPPPRVRGVGRGLGVQLHVEGGGRVRHGGRPTCSRERGGGARGEGRYVHPAGGGSPMEWPGKRRPGRVRETQSGGLGLGKLGIWPL